MTNTKHKMPWVEIINKLTAPEIDKQTLFETLHDVMGEKNKMKEMGLPSLAAVVSLKSFEAVKRAETYTKNVSKALPQISKIADKKRKHEMLDMLNKMAPRPYDYVVIGLNAYLKMDKKHSIEGFYREYDKFVAEHHPVKMLSPNVMHMLNERQMQA